jgi:hypothetical protein
MANRLVTYFFGRLNLIPIITVVDEKVDFIFKALRSNTITEERGHIWRFSEVGEFTNNEGLFAHGYLVKYKAETAEEVVVPETGDIADEAIKNPVVAKSRFFLHIASGLIAFRPVSGQINQGQFRKQFARLIEEAYDRVFISTEISLIQDRIQIQETLRRVENVSRIEIHLVPSNPSTSIWKDIDKDLKETGTVKYTEIRDTNEKKTSGSTILNDEALLHKLIMAEDGYGEMKVRGKVEGKIRVVSTKDNPVTTSAPNDKHSAEHVYGNLQSAIRNIFGRFEK